MEKGYSIGKNRTNNQCEYFAVLVGLSLLSQKANYNDKIIVYSDSQLVVKQLTRKWKVRDEKLKLIFDWVNDYIIKYTNLNVKHIPRESNKKADFLANKAVRDRICNENK